MKQIITASLILLFLLPIIFLSGCDKKQPDKEKTIKSAQKILPKTNTTIKIQEQSTDKIDEKKVGSLVSRFSNMLGNLVNFGGGDIYMKTNQIDLAEFVKGKTDRELYIFMKNSKLKSPYASKQVAEYLLEHINDEAMYLEVSHTYASLLRLIGDESDIKRAKSVCQKVEEIYVNSDQYQHFKAREKIIIIMNAYGIILIDNKLRKNIVDTIRKYGKTPEERSAADYYDAMLKIEDGSPENLKKARFLLQGVQKRGTYAYYDATEKDIKQWLENFDDWTIKVKSRIKTAPKSCLGIAKNLKNIKY